MKSLIELNWISLSRAVRRRTLPEILTAIALLGFLGLKTRALHPVPGDENIYFFLAKRIAEGALPYRDFFFAHPPLHLVPASVSFGLAGFTFPLAKALPAVFAAMALVFVIRAAGRLGNWHTLLAALLFMLSYDVLRSSSHFTGANLAAALVALGFERLTAGRDRQAGVSFAAATLAAIYAAPSGLGALLVLSVVQRRRAYRFALSALITLLLVHGLFLTLAGEAYFQQVFLYHLDKPARAGYSVFPVIVDTLANQMGLSLGALIGTLVLLAHRVRTRSEKIPHHLLLAWLTMIAACLHLVASLAQSRVYSFYFQPLFVALTLLATFGYVIAARSGYGALMRFLERQGGLATLRAVSLRKVAASGVLAFAVALELATPGIGAYLGHESHRMNLEPMLATIRAHVQSDECIFGDSSMTPLLALAAERCIANDEADTNVLRFTSGATDLEAMLAALSANPPPMVVARAGYGIAALPTFQSWLTANYALAATHEDHRTRRVLFFRRKG